jgi:hypothetical protein
VQLVHVWEILNPSQINSPGVAISLHFLGYCRAGLTRAARPCFGLEPIPE